MKKLLIVDDELGTRESLRMIFDREYDIITAATGEEALGIIEGLRPSLVLLDIIMPGMDGLAVLERINEIDKDIIVIMITATKTVKTAVHAMKLGAYDYITKPFDLDEIRLIIKKALSTQDLRNEVKILRAEIDKGYSFGNIVGNTGIMREIFDTIKQIADSKTTVLIEGESGTGKELVAKAIHFNSNRKGKPFIAINCAGIPESLIESELFGHEKGAFTNAYGRKLGRFEMADSGTLFLDEISELSLATQAKILRFLQERELVRVGGTETINVDVRLIAATNRNLEDSVTNGTFREDLYYRIKVVPIHLPPLRERKEDIPLLVNHFLSKIMKEKEAKAKSISSEALDLLIEYNWPGNIRELENIIARITLLSKNSRVFPEDLPSNIRGNAKLNLIKEAVLEGKLSFEKAEAEFERDIILNTLEKTNYVQSRAAELLGISRRILKYKMDKLGIEGTAG
ncbi:MAG: sigma-54-dependent Fis family transcriptional regulator [Deltaproteobacteria bacterium]|jgi:DNA-binding NtrC family response regulator|nr:MAG: sigma-54-dependent Fis family transcriptional regulator [Deltaproteobacteria bacterium]